MQQKSSRSTGPTSTENATSGSAESTTLSQSTSSAEDFPAKIFPTPAEGQVLLESDQDCSLKPFAWFDNSDPEQLCWRTWQRCVLGDWTSYSERWPTAGMIVNGIAYRLPPLVRRISEIGYGLLPTPQARDWKDGSKPSRHGRNNASLPVELSELGHPGRMLPAFPEWVMGFPIGWTDLEDSETL